MEIGDEQLLLGSTSSCQVFFESNSQPEIKAVFKRHEDELSVSIFDSNFKINLNEKELFQASFTESSFFSIGEFQIVVNIHDNVNEASGLQESCEIPILPRIKATELDQLLNSDSITNSEDRYNNTEKISKENSNLVSIDGEKCDILFDETHFKKSYDLLVKCNEFDFSDYNDPYADEEVASGASIFTRIDEECLQISHLNNNVLLDLEYFSLSQSQIYLSSKKSGKNHFMVHDLPNKRFKYILTRANKVYVSSPNDYQMSVMLNGEISDTHQNSVVLPRNGRVILTRGTSQIMVEVSKHPPKIATAHLLEVEQGLLRTQKVMWSLAIMALLFVWITGEIPSLPKPSKKEVVIIYKRKIKKEPLKPKEDIVVKEVVQLDETPKEIESPKKKIASKPIPISIPDQKIEKKPEPKMAQIEKKLPLKETPLTKKPTKKLAKNILKKRATSKKVVSKEVAIQKQAPRKVFKFNVASEMKTTLGKKDSNLAKIKEKEFYTTNISKGTKINSSIVSTNIETSDLSIAGYDDKEIGNLKGANGAKGLASNKRSTASAYEESTTKILGAIDPELVRKLLREHTPEFRYCYQKEIIRENPNLTGVFDIVFQISPQGEGRNVKIIAKDSMFSQAGSSCIQRVIAMIKFPKPKGGGIVDIRQPMNFVSNRDK